jgi:hypothetical protein
MSIPRKPKPAKLVVGMFMQDKPLLMETARILRTSYGPVDIVSPWLPFDHTDYYAPEMGAHLFRRFICFDMLIQQDALPDIKCFTNDLEDRFSKGGKRLINIDPGYFVPERFVLATGKNYAHRVYLKAGIYADLTLTYRKGRFHPLEWTYPDYAGKPIVSFLESVRDKYFYQLGEFPDSVPSGTKGDYLATL